jgi:hydrogenase nickel incorporation protein HypA/HybF
MHEASLAQSIVETVLRHAEAHRALAVKAVRIELGELTFYNPEQVKFWVKIGLENTVAQKARLLFKTVKGAVRCETCGFEGDLNSRQDPVFHLVLPDFSCPSCGGKAVSIVRGKEAVVRNIRIVEGSIGEERDPPSP